MSNVRTDNDNLVDAAKILGLILLVCLGLWGCARNPGAASSDRSNALEMRCVKLEQDIRSITQMRDRARKDLGSAEEQLVRLHKELALRTGECDRLRQQVKAGLIEREQMNRLLVQRTGERDEAQQRWERVRKGLQELISHEEVPIRVPGLPVLPVHTAGKPTNTQS